MPVLLLVLAVLVLPARAQAPGAVEPSVGIALTGTGIGVGGTIQATSTFSVSAEVSAVPFGLGIDLGEIEDLRYETDLQAFSVTVMGHVHPFGGGFALGAGAYIGGYGLDGTAEAEDDVEIGDGTYTPDELGTITADIRLGGPAAVVEIGRRGRGVNVGLGVAVPARPRVELAFSGSAAQDPDFQQDVDREVEDIEDELGVVPVLPFLRLGYQFGL
ncbi:MAG: hypothetical protein AAGJ11_10810 [Bacteroidota bacterium]